MLISTSQRSIPLHSTHLAQVNILHNRGRALGKCLSRSSSCHTRMRTRVQIPVRLRMECVFETPVRLHWDERQETGKSPEACGSARLLYRIRNNKINLSKQGGRQGSQPRLFSDLHMCFVAYTYLCTYMNIHTQHAYHNTPFTHTCAHTYIHTDTRFW